MMTGERLENANLIEQMKTYEDLLNKSIVWDNVMIVIPKMDYNPMKCSEEDWEQELQD